MIDLVLFVYCYVCIKYFQITDTPPDVVEVVVPDQNTFEDHLQSQTEKDVEVKMIVRY